MAAQITELVRFEAEDELIVDRIVQILSEESVAQQSLASAAGDNPFPYNLRVFAERATPWADYESAPDPETEDARSIVNVWFQRANVDAGASESLGRQKIDGTFHVDCYGYEPATGNSSGHTAGDKGAARNANRTRTICWNILRAGYYSFLGFPRGKETGGVQFVLRVWPSQWETFQPQISNRQAVHVIGARLSLTVEYNQLPPEVLGQIIDTIHVEVNQASDEQTIAEAEWVYPEVVSIATNVDGDTVTITVDEDLDAAHVPSASDFALTGTLGVPTGTVVLGGAGNREIAIPVDPTILQGDEPLLSYEGGTIFTDIYSVPMGELDAAVTNNSTAT